MIVLPIKSVDIEASVGGIITLPKPATTLVITFKKTREWGFWTPKGFVRWQLYNRSEHC